MNQFWLRFVLFMGLWVICISIYSIHLPLSILTFALAAAIYFLLSLKKAVFPLLFFISIVVLFHGFFLTDEVLFSIVILFYLTMDSIHFLKEKDFYIYLMVHLLFIVLFMYGKQQVIFEVIILYMFLVLLFVQLHRLHMESLEKSDMYDQLLDEYRKLKRMNAAVEHHAKVEERNKIARDIHDSVGHRLTALMMKLEMLSIQHKTNEYDELKQMAKDSLEETRTAVSALQEEENEGISTIVQLIRKLEAESHIRVQFTMKQGVLSIPLSNEKNVVLYRVIQESLTNAMRHSASRQVMITLGKSATGDVAFEIKNAITEPKSFSAGFGLTNMRRRVEKVNGQIRVYQTEKEFVVAGMIPSEER